MLASAASDALTVVFHSVSTMYLDDDRLRAASSRRSHAPAAEGPLAWVVFEGPRGMTRTTAASPSTSRVWPGGETRRLAKVDFHAAWLEWGGR